jgi:hypothetical protein
MGLSLQKLLQLVSLTNHQQRLKEKNPSSKHLFLACVIRFLILLTLKTKCGCITQSPTRECAIFNLSASKRMES